MKAALNTNPIEEAFLKFKSGIVTIWELQSDVNVINRKSNFVFIIVGLGNQI